MNKVQTAVDKISQHKTAQNDYPCMKETFHTKKVTTSEFGFEIILDNFSCKPLTAYLFNKTTFWNF